MGARNMLELLPFLCLLPSICGLRAAGWVDESLRLKHETWSGSDRWIDVGHSIGQLRRQVRLGRKISGGCISQRARLDRHGGGGACTLI